MENLKELEKAVRKNVLADIHLNLLDKQIDGEIIPETVFETLKQLKDYYETL